MQLILSSRSHFPLWVRASLLVGIIALSACSTSKPSASAPASQAGTPSPSPAAAAPVQKCWFGLFTCAASPAPKKSATVTQPDIAKVTASAPVPQASTPTPSPAAAAPVQKCWFGLFTCAASPAPEKSTTVARPDVVTVTATGDTSEKITNQKAIESVIAASATSTNTDAALPVAPAPTTASTAAPIAAATPSAPAQQRWLGIFKPYKMDIQQGNFISHEVASKLREGMSKEQVRFLLGAPLLNDMFHAERWDYVFRLQKGDGLLTSTRLTVFFKDNQVSRFENTPLPNEAEYLNHISGSDAKKPAPTPASNTMPSTSPNKPVASTTPNNS